MVSSYPDVTSRIAHVMAECGYPTDAEFARGIPVKTAQNIGAWRLRNSFGKADVKIAEATGADLMWLRTGKGEPFPNGPIRYVPKGGFLAADADDRLADAEESIIALGGVLAVVMRSLGRLAPAEAAAVALEVRRTLAKPGRAPEVLRTLLAAADSAVPAAAPSAPSRLARKQR